MSTSHDVVVVGGGPAGASSSAILAEQGHRVLLLERFASCAEWMREGSEDRHFGKLMKKHPEADGAVTDCLGGDVNKDDSTLWAQVRELVRLPEDLLVLVGDAAFDRDAA